MLLAIDEEKAKQIVIEYGELIKRQIELQKDIECFLKKWKIPKPELLRKE